MGTRALGALVALAACLALAGPGIAAGRLPEAGTLVPGESLGGLRIGMTKARVRSTWGRDFGRCRSCGLETWYFTYRRFETQGAAVSFEGGRVERVYTLWQPPGWHDARGLTLGAAEADVNAALGRVSRRDCDGYTALIKTGRKASSIYYLREGLLWGLGLIRSGFPPCV